VDGAHWDGEMGAINHMLTEKSRGNAPAILFDNVPGYPQGFRTLYGQLSSARRIALTLGLPLEYERKVDVVQNYHARMQDLKPLPPRFVNDGPIFENVVEGDDVDVLKFPVPRHHELDTARFIGTADCVMTQDPDTGWFNLGAYRSQVYDGKTVGCQITEGKHGRIHRDKYFERGQPMKVVILCGQDPLLFMLSSSPLPEVGEMDIAGGLRGEPSTWCVGPTGFPIPADCRNRDRRRDGAGQVKPEVRSANGWATTPRHAGAPCQREDDPHRNDPILTCAPQHKPVDETGLLKGIAGAAHPARLDAWRRP
jgi:4-hydroxy-3-polyprenylbenzoate decarboxylase